MIEIEPAARVVVEVRTIAVIRVVLDDGDALFRERLADALGDGRLAGAAPARDPDDERRHGRRPYLKRATMGSFGSIRDSSLRPPSRRARSRGSAQGRARGRPEAAASCSDPPA